MMELVAVGLWLCRCGPVTSEREGVSAPKISLVPTTATARGTVLRSQETQDKSAVSSNPQLTARETAQSVRVSVADWISLGGMKE